MDPMEAVFDALGNATRRRILDIVKERPGSAVGEVAAEFHTTRIAVMRHLTVLEEAGLLLSGKEGRRRRLYHNPVPIQMIYDRWTTEYSGFWAAQMADVKYRIEGGSQGKRRRHGGDGEAGVAGRHPGKDRGRVA
jgi:predicted transcriptional regulator